jgi:hypothetical protein
MSAFHDIEKIHHNSTSNSRGTATLISSKFRQTIVDCFSDRNGNILLLKLAVGNITLTLGSIYGPNNDDFEFFVIIDDKIKSFGSDHTIIGGDGNTTLDPRHNDINIDTFNTVGILSTRRSNRIIQLCNAKGPLELPQGKRTTFSTGGRRCPNFSDIRHPKPGWKRVRDPDCSPGERKQNNQCSDKKTCTFQAERAQKKAWHKQGVPPPPRGNRGTGQGRRGSRKRSQKGRSLQALRPSKSRKPFRQKNNLLKP